MTVAGGSEVGVFETIPIGRIRPSRHNQRMALEGVQDLVSSIEQNGLMEPLVVRPVQGWFEVVAGHRRLEACRTLNMRRVPCHVVSMDDKQAYETSLVENVQRQNLNPLEEAVAFRRYIEEYGYGGVSELARKIGKSQTYVSRRVSLLCLPEPVKDQVVRRRINPAVAQELVQLQEAEAEALAETASREGLSRREVRLLAKQAKPDQTRRAVDFEARKGRTGPADRALSKSITSLRVCLMRLDDAIDSIGDENWIVREGLVNDRGVLHQILDGEIRLKVRSQRRSARATR